MNPFKKLFYKVVSKIKQDPSILIKAEISAKLEYAKAKGMVGKVEDEIAFIKDYVYKNEFDHLRHFNSSELDKLGVKYLQDKLKTGKNPIQWDWQYDAIKTIKRGGGDCNSLNRVIQVYRHTLGEQAFLVTYVCVNPMANHTTCIIKTIDGYIDCDYGYFKGYSKDKPAFKSLKGAIDAIAQKDIVLSYVAQDINWKFVDIH
jgi:hypothetical protein